VPSQEHNGTAFNSLHGTPTLTPQTPHPKISNAVRRRTHMLHGVYITLTWHICRSRDI